MPLNQADKDEIESLFVSLWYGEKQEQSDARGKLDALKQHSPTHRDYILSHERLNDQISLNTAALRQRYIRVLDPAPVAAPARRGALPVRVPIAWLSGVFLLIGAIFVWNTNPVLSARAGAASIGQQTTLQLDDGSEVLLNTDTSIRYLNRLRSRELVLERGEALFSVSHNVWRPFSVRVGNIEIKDIGTKFSVRRQQSGVDVAVLEGEVAVHLSTTSQPVQLTANQAIRTTGTNVAAVDPDMLVAWKDRRVDFDGASLRSVVSELERYRTAPIILADERAGRTRLSGGFSTEDVDRLLRTLPQVAAVSVTFRPDGTAIIASR
ncbi:FecR domain-containing protein (plasmid) [Burkholderia sp. FERM BP-3421]|uniref:FecR family protein n=1 Tax=Burkholderia sp. FERM BP-3421 TaxID=1494466 RepID=UPI002361625D|nr:FecR domain-containing protein [Burkholderia sp. FERM BP-3421]WDD90355.1 FecR domain-containing protein [Burkholderia sp. FERM BP-3421]